MFGQEMKQILILCITLFVIEDSIAGFHFPQDRVPIQIVGDGGKRLDEIRIPEVEFHDVPAVDGFRHLLKLVNEGSDEGSAPFELAFNLSKVEGLLDPVTLKLTDVSATVAFQYLTALTRNHFSVCEHLIVVIPEPEGGFEAKAADDQLPARPKSNAE